MGMMDIFKTSPFLPALSAAIRRPEDVTGLWWQQPQTPLTQIVIDDIFGDMPEFVDRVTAMKVAPIVRGRDLIVGGISDLPLIAYAGDTRLETQPTWLYRTNDVSPWHRMAFTLDDLIFNDCALWWRENGEGGTLLSAWRIPPEFWRINEDRQIEVQTTEGNFEVQDSKNLIYFPGPGGGLLNTARDTIRGARAIDRAWTARVQSPIPPTLFQQTEQEVADDADVQGLLTSWGTARRNPETAGTAFVPYGLTPVFPPVNDDSQMFIEGRNAIRLDIANHLNIPASLLDGSTATASLTYVTAEGQKSSFHEQSLRFWTAPIEHRLSMDDIVPRGQRVRFDITYTTQIAPTGEPGED
jgi:hypothetical protein